MKPNSYVVCKVGDDKPFLGRIDKVREGTILVALEKDIQYKRNVIEVKKKDVRAMLGEDPLPGKAFGFDLNNLYRKTIVHDFWGNIHFFIKMEKDVMIRLKKGLDDTAKRVEKLGLSAYANVFETEIRAKQGKYAGMYKHTTSEDKPNVVWYAPACAPTQEYMDYVIFHEFGHVLRFNGLKSNKMRNRWLRLYQSTIAQVKVDKSTLRQILVSLEDSDPEKDSFKTAIRAATADESPRVSKAVAQWLKETHRITGKELEIMWRASGLKDIEKYWPDHMIDTHDLKPRLTEYATKNMEELFAEAFAFYCQKKKIPPEIESLLEDSLARIKVEGDRGTDSE